MGYRKTAFPHGTSKIPRTGSRQESDGQQEEIECEWNRKYCHWPEYSGGTVWLQGSTLSNGPSPGSRGILGRAQPLQPRSFAGKAGLPPTLHPHPPCS